jgi:ADP-ribosyl-[dinitrogen reductase] hydrolase
MSAIGLDLSDRFRGCLLGLAVGDAVGTTLEFRARGTFEPMTDMVGGGPFHLQPGQWTDDTSMALCLAASLTETGTFDAADQMRRYLDWRNNGYMSSIGRCFDIGDATTIALSRYARTGEPFSGSVDPNSAGNGCIMRLAPVPMFFFPNAAQVAHFSAESSRTTHGAAECLQASRIFGEMLRRALAGNSKDEILSGIELDGTESGGIRDIVNGTYRSKTREQIRGSGYVVECLEAALWCFWTTNTFRDAVLAAANLGNDADTTAAVCGQIAGAFYGKSGIPAHWLQKLHMREEIKELAEKLMAH